MIEPRPPTRNNNLTRQLNDSRMIVRRKKVTLRKGIVGVISDTHGLIRPEALAALKENRTASGPGTALPEIQEAFLFDHRWYPGAGKMHSAESFCGLFTSFETS